MRRKFLAILLTVSMLCLSACGQKDNTPAAPSSASDTTAVSEQEESSSVMESASEPETSTEEISLSETSPAETSAPETSAADTSAAITENNTDTEEATTPAERKNPYYGSLKVTGTQLVDSNNEPVQLRGISTHGLAWYPEYVNRDCFQELRDNWNVNVIRLAMYTAEYGGYCNGGDQAALKELIDKGVTYATELEMYAIIDWHILSDNNPNIHKAEAMEFFDEMSKKYADHENILYEICNEPNGSTTWSDVKSYALEIIPVIRANAPDAVILVGTPNWSQYVDQAAADPILVYDNIMYTLHFYADTHRDNLRAQMQNAVQNGLPVFVSEYGICDASGGGAINTEEANLWIEAMDRLGISYVAWNLSNKEETSAILKSSCTKTSHFEVEDLSSSGKWLYEMLTGNGFGAAQEEKSESSAITETKSSGQNTGAIDWSAELVNSWSSNGENYYQYNLTLTNNTSADCTSWLVEIPFQSTVTISDGWNGNYSAHDSTLRITSKEYNGSIPAGESISEVGFIVQGGGGIQ